MTKPTKGFVVGVQITPETAALDTLAPDDGIWLGTIGFALSAASAGETRPGDVPDDHLALFASSNGYGVMSYLSRDQARALHEALYILLGEST